MDWLYALHKGWLPFVFSAFAVVAEKDAQLPVPEQHIWLEHVDVGTIVREGELYEPFELIVRKMLEISTGPMRCLDAMPIIAANTLQALALISPNKISMFTPEIRKEEVLKYLGAAFTLLNTCLSQDPGTNTIFL